MLRQDSHSLQRTNTICRSNYQTNLTRCFSTKLLRPNQKLIPNGYGPKRFMVFPDTWNHPQRQTCSICPYRHLPLHYGKVPPINKSRDLYKRTTPWILGRYHNSASKNALQKFTRHLIVPSNAKKGPDGYAYNAPRTDFFVDNMISAK